MGCKLESAAACNWIQKLDANRAKEEAQVAQARARRLAPAAVALPGLGVTIRAAGGADFTATATKNARGREGAWLERKNERVRGMLLAIAGPLF